MNGQLYVIRQGDLVGTALEALAAQTVSLVGAQTGSLLLLQPLPKGHKAALCHIAAGTPILKYGAEIGVASREIQPGEHVHLHNLKSRLDTRSSQIDPVTGKVLDTSYD
ncbi:MAG: UxaA family hydrolase [Anaerotruncus sp.]|jgi:hypothetical protein|nr:UxaA family hydrolase [Anaerotruncus sp.]